MYPTFPSFRRPPPDAPQHRFSTLPVSVLGFPISWVWASPLASWLATTPGRITFVILRTDDSPPVALHPASRRRSYLRLQAGERLPEGDFHPSDRVHSQAHWHSGPPLCLGNSPAEGGWATIASGNSSKQARQSLVVGRVEGEGGSARSLRVDVGTLLDAAQCAA